MESQKSWARLDNLTQQQKNPILKMKEIEA